LLSSPAAAGGAIVLLLAARWIWIAGLGDYAWSYEVAARLLRGEVYYRDFPLLYGPLSHYTLAGLMGILGSHLFVYHLHLWGWYGAALAAGGLLARELGASREAQTAGLALGAVMACPAFSWGHAFNYQAPFLAAVATLGVLRAQRSGGLGGAALSGAAAALCIYSKQNVGLAVAAVIPVFLPRRSLPAYAAALGAVFLGIFGYLAAAAGAGEVARQLFADPAQAKAGLVTILARATPRVILPLGVPGRRGWEAAITALAWAALLGPALRIATRRAGRSERAGRQTPLTLAAVAAAGVAVALSLLRVETSPLNQWLWFPWPWFLQLVYILFVLAGVAALARGREPGWTAAVAVGLAVTMAQEASNPNFVYSATLALPLLCALLGRAQIRWAPAALAGGVGAVYLLGTTAAGPVSRYGLSAYQPTVALPSDSPFAGLRAPEPFARRTWELWAEAHPRLEGRKVLWLVGGGGPYLAYGGRPVFNAPCYMPDTFPGRLEGRLLEAWRQDPPEAVMLAEDFGGLPQAPRLHADYMKSHLLSSYQEVWRSRTEPRLGLWLRSTGPGRGQVLGNLNILETAPGPGADAAGPRGHARHSGLQGHGGRRLKDAARFFVAGVGVEDLLARGQVHDLGLLAESGRHDLREMFHRIGCVAANVDDLVAGRRKLDGAGQVRRDIVDIAEGPALGAVAEDGQRAATENLVHEDAENVAIGVAEVLVLAIDVVGPEDDVVQTEHLVRGAQVELDGILADAVGVFRLRREVLGHGELVGPIDGDGRGEDEEPDFVLHGFVDEIDAADDIGFVIEAPDEMRESLGGVGGEMIDVIEAMLGKQAGQEGRIGHRSLEEAGLRGNLIAKAAGEIVERDHFVTERQAMADDVGADEASTAGDEGARRHLR
jgi:hypothetical protein